MAGESSEFNFDTIFSTEPDPTDSVETMLSKMRDLDATVAHRELLQEMEEREKQQRSAEGYVRKFGAYSDETLNSIEQSRETFIDTIALLGKKIMYLVTRRVPDIEQAKWLPVEKDFSDVAVMWLPNSRHLNCQYRTRHVVGGSIPNTQFFVHLPTEAEDANHDTVQGRRNTVGPTGAQNIKPFTEDGELTSPQETIHYLRLLREFTYYAGIALIEPEEQAQAA